MVQPLRRHISKIFGVYVNWLRWDPVIGNEGTVLTK